MDLLVETMLEPGGGAGMDPISETGGMLVAK